MLVLVKPKSQQSPTRIPMIVAITTTLAMGACSDSERTNFQADADSGILVPAVTDDPFAESWNLDCGVVDCPENDASRNALNGQVG